MRPSLLVLLGLALEAAPRPQPPPLLQIHREPLKPGSEASYLEVESETARLCAELGCPHPYLAIESLSGSKEVWFFNGYESWAEQRQVADAYAKNAPLLEALLRNSKRKAALTGESANAFASHRQALSRGTPWVLGQGRFLVITVINNSPRKAGTVFETPDGTRFAIIPAQARAEADAAAAAAGAQSRVFAVRPAWSFPAKEWTLLDPELWAPRSGS
jgi:hypothetical protein